MSYLFKEKDTMIGLIFSFKLLSSLILKTKMAQSKRKVGKETEIKVHLNIESVSEEFYLRY